MPPREHAPALTPQREKHFVERFNEPEDNYNLLREGVQGFAFEDSKPWSERNDTESILRLYTKFTDKMIGVADGSIEHRDVVDPVNPELSSETPDVMVFLDKSARPVSWFMDAFWDQFAKEDAEKPEFEYLNIDRTNWFMKQGHVREIAERYLGPEHFDIDKVPEEEFARIRALFVDGDLSEETWQDDVWKMDTRLDDKKIVIVDETKNKGGTLHIAVNLLKKAIPEATVSGIYFWESSSRIINTRGEMQTESVPVWYDAKNPMGRGIGDISKAYYERAYEQDPSQENLRRKIGWSVLSAPHFDVDTYETIEDNRAKRLEQDIAYLSYAVAEGKVLRVPSQLRDDDERIAIVEDQGLQIREATEWAARARAAKKRHAQTK